MRRLPLDHPGVADHRSPGRFLWWLARGQWRTLVMGMVFGIIWMSSQAVLPALLGRAIDRGVAAKDTSALLTWAGLMLAVGLVQAVSGILRHRYAVTNWLTAAYRTVQLVGRQSCDLGATLPRRVSTGEVVAIGTSDLSHLGQVMDVSARFSGAVVSFLLVSAILLATSVTLGLVVLARLLAGGHLGHPADEAALSLGLVMIASFLIGSRLPQFNLPAITGYMLTGVLLGPSLLEHIFGTFPIVSESGLRDLSLINHIALGLIAFTAGGELKLSELRQGWRSLLSITVVQSLVGLIGVGGCIYFLGHRFPGFEAIESKGMLVIAVLLGCTAVANSPATTIAVINESRSAGPLTQATLGVTVIKDIVVIAAFAAAFTVARSIMEPDQGSGLEVALEIGWEIVGSLLLGVALGWLLSVFIERLGEELPLVLLAAAFLAVYLAEHVHLHGLMICMTAGFVVENFSPHGEEFIHAVERYSLPVYVVFFTMAGAEMHLDSLLTVGWTPVILVTLRVLFTYVGTWAGARLAGESPTICRYAGLGFLGQAGVTLGFAVIISRGFHQIGGLLSTVIVAAVAVNQIIGPIAFRYALGVAGEVGARQERRQAGSEEPF
ncbi:MAG: cation:proton antiporter [Candidatus Eremiobacteraeota bacterium]|nr:cation:proton antiporter [Candidatus Eremiobacteraeota bacterium]